MSSGGPAEGAAVATIIGNIFISSEKLGNPLPHHHVFNLFLPACGTDGGCVGTDAVKDMKGLLWVSWRLILIRTC